MVRYKLNGVVYELNVEEITGEATPNGPHYRAKGHFGLVTDVVNRCEACGRFDTRPKTARSIEEMVDFGWIIPVEVDLPPKGDPLW